MLSLSLSGFLAFLNSAIFVVGYIVNNNLFPEPLSPEEEKMYLGKYENGDEEARNILIEKNLRLVAHVAKKYSSSNVSTDDLISIGTIGLIKGICIDNEILMYLRSYKKVATEVYLNEPIGKDKDDNEVTLLEVLENDEKNIEDEIDLKIKIKKMYEKMEKVLKERERKILEMRYGLNGNKPITQHQIAKMLGISRSYVSRIETKAIGKLAKEIKE